MKVACPSCNTNLNIDDKKIPAGGARIKCPTCQQIFPVKPGAATMPATAAVPLPGQSAPRSSAVPLPGISAPTPSMPSWEDESTRVASASMIQGALSQGAPPSNIQARPPAAPPAVPRVQGAVPLPGISAPAVSMPSWEDESTQVASASQIAGALSQGAPPSNVNVAPPVAPPAVPRAQRAVPLPGITAAAPQQTQWEDEKTRVGTDEAPVPSRGAVDFDFDLEQATHTNPVPLPGNYEPTRVGARPTSIPLPGATPDDVGFADEADIGSVEDAPTRNYPVIRSDGSSGAVPLPGAYDEPPDLSAMPTHAVPLPGSHRAKADSSAVPLPGAYDEPPDLSAMPTHAVPLPGSNRGKADSSAMPTAAVALPGARRNQVPLGELPDQPVPLPGDYAPTGSYQSLTGEDLPPPEEFDLTQPPPATTMPSTPQFDLSDLPSPRGVAPKIAPPAPSFSDLPSPRGAAPAAAPSYSDLPSPRGAAPKKAAPQYSDLPSPAQGSHDPLDAPDFSDLPMPSTPDLPSPATAGDFSFEMADLPPPPAPVRAPIASAAPPPGAPQAPTGFGEVDFDSAAESLEFDPTSAPKGKADDDLEADLSAPSPASTKPVAAGDGLEMLSFIDQTAKDAGAGAGQNKARRFHIRRRSGKVFGPFEDAVIIKMLEDGQLLGNEEVSLDSESWAPIGGEPTFQAAITRLMESPSSKPTTAMPQLGEQSPQQVASMDRLKTLYEGRMAAVAVVQGKEPVPFRKKLPFILVGVLLVAGLGTGGFLGTTPYGYFGLKVLFPAKVKAGSREFAELTGAKKDLQSDTFKGYQQVRETAQVTLRVKEYPEARAIWCQAIFYLQRKYAAATPAEIAEANAQLANIELLGARHPEVVKARAGYELSNKHPDAALALLGDALARSENADDVELAFLRVEAFMQKSQLSQAKSELEAILKKKPESARALHALGNLHQLQKEADLAAGRYEEALKADPDHASSAVELAAIELLIRKDLVKGGAVVDQALAESRRDKLGPAELGKALALKAETLSMQHKPAEAIPLFEEALKADPGNSFTKVRLGSAYVALHDHEKALPLFKEAAEASPESLEYAEAYMGSLIALGKMEDALKVVEATSQRFPGNAHLAYLSARVDDALDRTKEAIAAYLRASSADPTLVDAHLYLARLYMRFRRFNDAKPQLEEALQKAPDNAEVRVVMGELALSENDVERAETELNRALELNPTLSEAHVGLSKLELIKSRYDLALEQIDKALAINPRVFGGRVQRGTALWKLGRLEEAVKELEAARLDEPRNTQIVVTLGAVQLDKKDLNGATGTLMAALTNEPSNPDANFYLAKVQNLKAEHTGAIEHMRKALELEPKRPEFHFWMGRIFLDAKKNSEAVEEWKAALELDPKYTDALEALGHAFLERNDVKKAVQYFQRALGTDPNRTAVQAAIGDAYSQAEEWDQAISTYEKALQADPDLKQVYFKLGQAYAERKKWEPAITNYRKATAVEPDNANVWESLGYAYKERKQKPEAAQAFEHYLAKKPDAQNKKEIEDEIDYLKQER